MLPDGVTLAGEKLQLTPAGVERASEEAGKVGLLLSRLEQATLAKAFRGELTVAPEPALIS